MKKFLEFILYYIFFIIILFLQFNVISGKNIFGFKPNLIFCFILIFSIKKNIYISSILALIIGMYLDIIYLNELFFYTIIFTSISLFIGIIKDKYFTNNISSYVFLILISIILYDILIYGYYAINSATYFSILQFIIYILTSLIMNLIVSLIMYSIVGKIDDIQFNSNEGFKKWKE